MKSPLKGVLVAVGLVVPLALTGCSGQAAASGSEIKVGIYPNLINNFDYHVADAKGFFKDEKLTVKPITVNTGPDMATALISRTIDIGDESTPTVLPVLVTQKQDIKLLYGGLPIDSLLIARPGVDAPAASSNLEAVRSLKGKTVGITAAGSLTDWIARQIIKEAGLDPDKDVKLVTTGGTSTLVPALKGGKIDAAIIWNADRSRVGEEGKDYKVLASALDGTAGTGVDGILQEYYAARGDYVQQHPNQVKGYCTAISKAWQWAVDPANEKEVIPMLASWVNIPQDAAASLWKQERTRFTRQVDAAAWARQGSLLQNGSLPAYQDAVYADCGTMFKAG